MKFLRVGLVCSLLLIVTLPLRASDWRSSNSLNGDGSRGEEVLVREVESTENRIVFEYQFPEAVFKSSGISVRGKEAVKVIVGNCQQLSVSQEPIIPIVPLRFIIPFGKEIESVRVKSCRSSFILDAYTLEWGRKPVPLKVGANMEEVSYSREVYESDAPYPKEQCELVSVQKKCGVSIAILNLCPITLYPKSERVEQHRNMVLEIILKDVVKRGERQLAIRPERVVPEQLGIENPGALETYSFMPATRRVSNSIVTPAGSAEYLIIATNKIIEGTKNPSLNDLLHYRKSEGFTGKIVSYESIINAPGSDPLVLKMRNFITDAYNNWGTKYVFLAGTYRSCESQIKNKDLHYMVSAKATSGGGYQHTDVYYECLDGSYNHDTVSTPDSKKRFGEWTDGEDGGIPDFFAEVHIGRLMAMTPQDVSNAIYKMLEYEKSRGAFKSEVFLAGEALFPASKSPNDLMWYAKPSMMAVWNGGSDAGNVTKGLKDVPNVKLTTMFDADTCNNAPTPKHPEIRTVGWEADQMIEKINSDKFGIINHLGHGNEEHGLDIDVSKHTSQLINNNFPFLYTQACLNAGFMYKQNTERSFSRHLTAESRNYGISGGVFNMNLGYSPFSDDIEIYGPSERMNLQFWDAYVSEGLRRAGELHTDSHEDNVNFINEHHIKYCIYITTLLADPAMKIDMENISVPVVSEKLLSCEKEQGVALLNYNAERIALQIPRAGVYRVALLDLHGRVVSSVSKQLVVGKQLVKWRLSDVAKGLYILKVEGNKSVLEKKIVLPL